MPLDHADQRECLEVPVIIRGVLSLANDIGGTRAREEVVVLVSIRRKRRQNGRGNASLVCWEEPLEAQIIQRLIGVIAQEALNVLGPCLLYTSPSPRDRG